MPKILNAAFQHRFDSAYKVLRPLRYHVCGIERDNIKLIFLIYAELVASTVYVIAIPYDAKIFNERAALEGVIRVPYLKLPCIHDRRRFFVYVRNTPTIKKGADLTFSLGFVFKSSACWVIAFVHAIVREEAVFQSFGKTKSSTTLTAKYFNPEVIILAWNPDGNGGCLSAESPGRHRPSEKCNGFWRGCR